VADLDEDAYSSDEEEARPVRTRRGNNTNARPSHRQSDEESEEEGAEDSESDLSLDLDNDEFEKQQQRERHYARPSGRRRAGDDAFSTLRKSDRNKKKNAHYAAQKHSW
jgi:hypothetical protein